MMISYSNLKTRTLLATDEIIHVEGSLPSQRVGHDWFDFEDRLPGLLLSVLDEAKLAFAIVDRNARLVFFNDLFSAWHMAARNRNLKLNSGVELTSFKADIMRVFDTGDVSKRALGRSEAQGLLRFAPLRDVTFDRAEQDYVVVMLDMRGASPDKQDLSMLFGLTPSESTIAADIASGVPVNTIAKNREVAPGTVRVQLKAIFRKVGVCSQVELAAKLHRGYNG